MSLLTCTMPGCDTTAGCRCAQRPVIVPPAIAITPAMLKAAWHEARRWWPRKVVELRDCKACGQAKGYRVLETCILVDEPAPGFKEAIEAALRAGKETT